MPSVAGRHSRHYADGGRRRAMFVLQLPPETLDDLLRALTATGQVVMLKVGGRTVYRAAG